MALLTKQTMSTEQQQSAQQASVHMLQQALASLTPLQRQQILMLQHQLATGGQKPQPAAQQVCATQSQATGTATAEPAMPLLQPVTPQKSQTMPELSPVTPQRREEQASASPAPQVMPNLKPATPQQPMPELSPVTPHGTPEVPQCAGQGNQQQQQQQHVLQQQQQPVKMAASQQHMTSALLNVSSQSQPQRHEGHMTQQHSGHVTASHGQQKRVLMVHPQQIQQRMSVTQQTQQRALVSQQTQQRAPVVQHQGSGGSSHTSASSVKTSPPQAPFMLDHSDYIKPQTATQANSQPPRVRVQGVAPLQQPLQQTALNLVKKEGAPNPGGRVGVVQPPLTTMQQLLQQRQLQQQLTKAAAMMQESGKPITVKQQLELNTSLMRSRQIVEHLQKKILSELPTVGGVRVGPGGAAGRGSQVKQAAVGSAGQVQQQRDMSLMQHLISSRASQASVKDRVTVATKQQQQLVGTSASLLKTENSNKPEHRVVKKVKTVPKTLMPAASSSSVTATMQMPSASPQGYYIPGQGIVLTATPRTAMPGMQAASTGTNSSTATTAAANVAVSSLGTLLPGNALPSSQGVFPTQLQVVGGHFLAAGAQAGMIPPPAQVVTQLPIILTSRPVPNKASPLTPNTLRRNTAPPTSTPTISTLLASVPATTSSPDPPSPALTSNPHTTTTNTSIAAAAMLDSSSSHQAATQTTTTTTDGDVEVSSSPTPGGAGQISMQTIAIQTNLGDTNDLVDLHSPLLDDQSSPIMSDDAMKREEEEDDDDDAYDTDEQMSGMNTMLSSSAVVSGNVVIEDHMYSEMPPPDPHNGITDDHMYNMSAEASPTQAGTNSDHIYTQAIDSSTDSDHPDKKTHCTTSEAKGKPAKKKSKRKEAQQPRAEVIGKVRTRIVCSFFFPHSMSMII